MNHPLSISGECRSSNGTRQLCMIRSARPTSDSITISRTGTLFRSAIRTIAGLYSVSSQTYNLSTPSRSLSRSDSCATTDALDAAMFLVSLSADE